MSKKILVPWVMPEIGRAVLKNAKVEVAFLHGPRGEMPGTAALIAGILQSDVLIARGDRAVSRKVMSANPALRGIANYGVGYNNIDVASATELGIPVTNTPGVLTETTADLAWALLMATARRSRRRIGTPVPANGRGAGGPSWGSTSDRAGPIGPRSWASSASEESDRPWREGAGGSR